MEFLTIVLGLLFAFTLLQSLVFLAGIGKSNKLPPGPTLLPVIGCLHKLGDKPRQSMAALAKTYGPIMSLKLGQVTVIVISSSSSAREVLREQDVAFSSRYIPDALHAHDHYRLSVTWLPVADRWRSICKILNSNIFSGSRLDANEHLRSRKVQELVAYCRKSSQTGEAVDIGRAAFRTSLNLLSNTIFSKDLTDPYKDSAKGFKELVRDIMVEAGKRNLVDYFPILKKINPQGIRRRTLQLFDQLINDRLELRRSGKTPNNDVLDVCLNISEENPEDIDRTHVERMCLDLFIAGTDTTSSTVEWAMTEVLRNPETMEKAKKELEEVIGKGKILEVSIPARTNGRRRRPVVRERRS